MFTVVKPQAITNITGQAAAFLGSLNNRWDPITIWDPTVINTHKCPVRWRCVDQQHVFPFLFVLWHQQSLTQLEREIASDIQAQNKLSLRFQETKLPQVDRASLV